MFRIVHILHKVGFISLITSMCATWLNHDWAKYGCYCGRSEHYNDVIMRAMASQITSLTIVYPSVYWGTDQRKHQSSASLAFVRGIHRWSVNSPRKGPVTRKKCPFDDVIMRMDFSFHMPIPYTCMTDAEMILSGALGWVQSFKYLSSLIKISVEMHEAHKT